MTLEEFLLPKKQEELLHQTLSTDKNIEFATNFQREANKRAKITLDLRIKTESQIVYVNIKSGAYANLNSANQTGSDQFQLKQRIILKQTQQRMRAKQINNWQKIVQMYLLIIEKPTDHSNMEKQHWKLDFHENPSRLHLRLKRNYNFDSHISSKRYALEIF